VAVIWIASASSDTRRGLAATGFLFVTQVRTINPFLVARPDHHSVILFLFIMHLGVLAWAWSDPDRRDRFATIAGAIGAFSVWLSPEGLTAMVPGILWLGGLWVLRGSEWERPMRRYGLAAFAVTVVAWLVDPPPPGRLTFEFDRLSIAHVILFGVLGAVAVGLTMRTPATLQARVGSAAGAGVLAAGVLAVAMPKVFSGPMVDVPDDLWPFFLDNSAEWASMFEDGFSLRLLISRFGLSFLALGGYVWRFRRGNHLVALMAITHLTFIGLSLQQLRWETYLGVLDALALAWLFGRVLERFDAAPRMLKSLWPLAAVLFGIASAMLAVLSPPASTRADTAPVEQQCSTTDAVDALIDVAPTVVLTPLWWGPKLVYQTDHSAIGSPMHRNVDGIRYSHEVMVLPADEVPERLAERDITYIAWCHGHRWGPDVLDQPGLYADLQAETYPEWLDVEAVSNSAVRIGRVVTTN